MIVDVHAHYIPKNCSDFMGDRFLPNVGVPAKTGIARHPVSDLAEDISGRFELMDAAGVKKQVLSPHEEVNRRDAILFVHPAGTGICSPFIVDYGHRAAVGTSLEDATF